MGVMMSTDDDIIDLRVQATDSGVQFGDESFSVLDLRVIGDHVLSVAFLQAGFPVSQSPDEPPWVNRRTTVRACEGCVPFVTDLGMLMRAYQLLLATDVRSQISHLYDVKNRLSNEAINGQRLGAAARRRPRKK
jgi:hypothetical protein